MQGSVVRLLDANANRALEGMRVCEEIARFHLQDARAWQRLRRVRHGIARAIRQVGIAPVALVRARESRQDIGRQAGHDRIESLERLLLVNFQRAKEALRVLEECARLIAPRHADAFQRLRFEAYDVERMVLLRMEALRHS